MLDPYVYENTNILVNILGIKDKNKLEYYKKMKEER